MRVLPSVGVSDLHVVAFEKDCKGQWLNNSGSPEMERADSPVKASGILPKGFRERRKECETLVVE